MCSRLHSLTSYDMLNDAISINQECSTLRTHVLTTIHTLLNPYTKLLIQLNITIHDETEREVVLFDKLNVALSTIAAHSNNFHTSRTQVCISIAQATCLGCTTRGIVFGIEIEGYHLTRIITTAHFTTLLV